MPVFKTINKDFFKKWTSSMAYVLGFFAADGCMYINRRGGHFIEFTSIDKEHLEGIKILIGSNHHTSSRKKVPEGNEVSRFQIGSKDIYKDLTLLGFVPSKSNVMKFPIVPAKYISDFIRGYFDGDGHVSVTKYNRNDRVNKQATTIISGFTSGSKDFLKVLHDELKKHSRIIGGSLYHTKGYHLTFSVNDSKALAEFMYKNVKNLHLARKKVIFDKYFP